MAVGDTPNIRTWRLLSSVHAPNRERKLCPSSGELRYWPDAGIDRAYMSEIERGLANPTIDMLDRIAAVLGVDVGEFFIRPEPDEQPPKPLRAGRRRR